MPIRILLKNSLKWRFVLLRFCKCDGDFDEPNRTDESRILFLVYMEANPSCNTMTFNLGSAGVGNSIVSRSWAIKVKNYLESSRQDN